MSAERKNLTPEELHDVLETLDRVMEDAERLRRSVTQQLSEHRMNDQQELSSGVGGPDRSRRRS